ncbi:hypothetical protein D9756_011150 [Leucocoprinus leucothites]|uniref:DNA 3'-5' helicase n=1 Tax=Leucocoprinus leucothites TaxID=201217 RepID=A0A8H5CQ76_9AGAR|nr:hypothetical protein D9756_011150 [Leucoagaricus leucothites]
MSLLKNVDTVSDDSSADSDENVTEVFVTLKKEVGKYISPQEFVVGDDLEATKDLGSLLKLLCCATCRVLLTTETGLTHIRKQHSVKAKEDNYMTICMKLGIANEYPSPSDLSGGATISGLDVYTGALLCMAKGCGVIYATACSMIKHYRKRHMETGDVLPVDWPVVHAQKLDNNHHRHYFRVKSPPLLPKPENKWAWLERIEYSIDNIMGSTILTNPEARSQNAFLKQTKWPRHTTGHDSHHLRSLVALPGPGEFMGLQYTIRWIIDAAMALMDVTPSFILQRLSTKDWRSGISHKPFHELQTDDALQDYANELTRLVAFLLRNKGKYILPLPDAITTLINEIRELCPIRPLPPPTPKSTFDDYTLKIVELLISIWTRTWEPVPSNTIGDPTMCYLALRSLRSDSGWEHPSRVTPTIAKLCFAVRSIFLFRVHFGDGDDIGDFRQRYRELENWHYEGEDSTFNELVVLQHLASAIAYSTPSLPSFVWYDTEYRTEFTFRGSLITLWSLRDMASHLHKELYDVFFHKVLLGMPRVIDGFIADDLEASSPGYSFVSDPRNEKLYQRDMFMKWLLENPIYRKEFVIAVRPDGELIWNLGRIRQWLLAYSEALSYLMACVEVMAGSPSRGTELTCIQFRNTAYQTRGLCQIGRRMAVVAQYSKTTANTGRDTLIPHILDGFTEDFVKICVFVLHACAEQFIAILYPDRPDLVGLWHNNLFVKFDRRFNTEDLSSVLKQASLKTMGVALGVRDYRQVSICVRRAHCPTLEELIGLQDEDTAAALQAGHSRETEERLYGRTSGFIGNLPENLVEPYANASAQWATLLKLPQGGSGVRCWQLRESQLWRSHVPDDKSPHLLRYAQSKAAAQPDLDKEWNDMEAMYADPPNAAKNVSNPVHDASDTEKKGERQEFEDEDREEAKSEHSTGRAEESSREDAAGEDSYEAMVRASESELWDETGGVIGDYEALETVMQPYDQGDSGPSTKPREIAIGSQIYESNAALEADALRKMRLILRKPDCEWASDEQKRAVMAALPGDKDVIIALPTGAGKSIVPMLISTYRKNQILPLIVNLVSLQEDWERRLRESGIRYSVYKRDMRSFPPGPIVLVTVDLAVTPNFTSCIAHAGVGERLAGVVIDESHDIFVSRNFRSCMEKMWRLRTVAFQIIALSGTLPIILEKRLISELCLQQDAHVIRASSNRPELEYILEPRRDQEALLCRLREVIMVHKPTDRERILVYVNTCADGQSISDLLGCDFYCCNETICLPAARKEMVKRWREGIEGVNKVMVATTGFSAGNDYDCVRLVILATTPYEMTTALQEMGRAGRDHKPAKCCILPLGREESTHRVDDPKDFKGRQAMYKTLWKTDDCLRLCFTRYIDGDGGVSCGSDPRNQICSRCRDKLKPPPQVSHPINPFSRSPDDEDDAEPKRRAPPGPDTKGKGRVQQKPLRRLTEHPIPVLPSTTRQAANGSRGDYRSSPTNMDEFFALQGSSSQGSSLQGSSMGRVLVPASSPYHSSPHLGTNRGYQSTSLKRTSTSNPPFAEQARQVRRKTVAVDLAKVEYVARLQRLVDTIEGKCTVCMVRNKTIRGGHDHKANDCPYQDFRRFVNWKRHVRYNTPTHGSICTCCHIPQLEGVHAFITRGGSAFEECPYPDRTVPLAYAIFHHGETRRRAETYFSVEWENETEYAYWLCAGGVEKNKTNTTKILLWFIEQCWYRGD